MDGVLKLLNRTDWLLAFACLGYGAATGNWYVLAGGGLSLVVAWYNPSRRVKAWLEKKMLASPTRRREQAARDSAVRIAKEEAQFEAQQAAPEVAPDFRVRPQAYGPLRVSANKHNRLRPGDANLAGTMQKTWF